MNITHLNFNDRLDFVSQSLYIYCRISQGQAYNEPIQVDQAAADFYSQPNNWSITFSDDAAQREKILRLVKAEPGVSRSRIMRLTRLSKKEMDAAIDTLVEAELISLKREQDGRKGAPKFHIYPVRLSGGLK